MKSRLKKYINILVGPSSEDGHKEHMTDIPLVIASQNINLVCAGLLIFGMRLLKFTHSCIFDFIISLLLFRHQV